MSVESKKFNTQYIQDDKALIELCRQLAKAPLLAIDTEFVRTRTLYAKLGLLQVNDGTNLALIDPVAISDLSPFWHLLTNENICKVLHACSEDLEVFLTTANIETKPKNLIDSQIMMSFLGHGLSIGYASMIKHFLDIDVDKSASRTDWTKRPLSEKQLHYARADVEHLFTIYPQLLAELTHKGWLEAAQQETQLLIEQKYRPIDESLLYKKVKMSWRLNPKQLNLLKHLTAWRYQQAKARNLPIGFVVKDNTLMALASTNPQSMSAMNHLEGAEMLDIKHKGKAMLSVLKKANLDDVSQYPDKILRLDEHAGYKQTFKKVKDFIIEQAASSGLTVETLASKKQINQFLGWHYNINNAKTSDATIELLSRWRLILFGEKLKVFAENDFIE